jgi:hypothetical protein
MVWLGEKGRRRRRLGRRPSGEGNGRIETVMESLRGMNELELSLRPPSLEVKSVIEYDTAAAGEWSLPHSAMNEFFLVWCCFLANLHLARVEKSLLTRD